MSASLSDRRSPIDGAELRAPTDRRGWGYDRGTHLHAGVDLPGAPGTPVLAPESGTVELVARLPARPPFRGYAPAVLLRGASGRWHLLAHLSGSPDGADAPDAPLPRLEVGQPVQLGDTLGYVGHERHVHWEVRTRPLTTRRDEPIYVITVDPAAWLEGRDAPLSPDPHRGAPLDPSRRPLRRRQTEQLVGYRETRELMRGSSSPWAC